MLLDLGLGLGVRRSNTYNPYIKYNWGYEDVGEDGTMYLKDTTSPKFPAESFAGNGTYFDGVGHRLVNLNANCATSDFSLCAIVTKCRDSLFVYGGTYIVFNSTYMRIRVGLVIYDFTYEDIGVNLYTNESPLLLQITGNSHINIYINSVLKTSSIRSENGSFILNHINLTNTSTGQFKDIYLFDRTLTQQEIELNYKQPNNFFELARNDNTCVLNMPLSEKGEYRRNYADGQDYSIVNYTNSCDVTNLNYGSQQTQFITDSLGIRGELVDYFNGDGVGYVDTGWVPQIGESFAFEFVIKTKTDGLNHRFGEGIFYSDDRSDNTYLFYGDNYRVFTGDHIDNEYNHFIIYINSDSTMSGVFNGNTIMNSGVVSNEGISATFSLGVRAYNNYTDPSKMDSPIKLFQVHTDIVNMPTPEELYNKAVAKGLLDD
jgi:hypothetical protein